MEQSVIIAGFGGQGVVLIGQLLGYSATAAGKYATFYPAYGAEQRGGTANCTVVTANEEIGSPVVTEPDTVLALNEPSLDKFEPMVKSGGTIIVNSSLIEREVRRTDVRVLKVPGNDLAQEIGSPRVLNMVMLGAYLASSKAMTIEEILATMKEKMASKADMLPMNEAALRAGWKVVEG